MGKAPGPLDAVAYLHINLFGGGEMSVSGNIGDVRLALQMLDHARDAVLNQRKNRTEEGLLLPPRDVTVAPSQHFPLQTYGDVAPELRPVIDMPKGLA
jgi:hypothetical protein